MSWFVVSTNVNREQTAEINLMRQGFEVFAPQFEKKRCHARRVDTVLRPLFPGYIFVKFNPETTPWRSINGTIGVRYLLTLGSRPQEIKEAFVSGLRLQLNDNGIIEYTPPALSPGDTVEVMEGAMKGQIAKILSADSYGRVRILLSMMGRGVVSSITAESVEKLC